MPARFRSVITALVAAGASITLTSCGRDAVSPDVTSDRPMVSASVAQALASLRINEVESNMGPDDWVELYNRSNAPIDIGGYVFRDDNDVRVPYVFPTGTTIPANGFLVIAEAQFGFGLGSSDAARLFAPGGTQLIDSYAWTAHAATTYGRCPDGTGAFTVSTIITRGTANDCGPRIFVNEVESQSGVPGDWVELYNPNNAAVNIGGWVFRDNSATGYVIPDGTMIAANGYFVIEEAVLTFGIGAPDEARLFRADGTTLVDSYSWSAHASTTYGRCPDGTGSFATTAMATKGAANICPAAAADLYINEVESNLGTPGDWVELYNDGNTSIDLGGYVFRDNVDTRGYTIPAGMIIPSKAFLVIEEATFGFGLGGGDAARLFAPGGVTLVDSYTWATHASTTYGRCPDGTGAFATTSASTKGAPNTCPGQVFFATWPGEATITNGSATGLFGGNMSGLAYQPLAGLPTGVIWAVRNGPGALFRLTFINGLWTPRATRTWINGKALRYPNGMGDVDAEGVAAVGNAIYVAAERNNQANSVSRNSILRYNAAIETGPTLVATHEWNITADLPANGANLGLEAITRVPDAFLVARGFFDESRNQAYDPAAYPNHEGALFFVGVEATGNVHAYALNHATGGFTRIATFTSGFASVMELQFDAELGQFWAICDNTCSGRSTVLQIDTQPGSPTLGRFTVTQRFARPAGMPDLNNEGFTFAPLAECVNGRRPTLWADDGETGGLALRRGSLTCAAF